MKLVTRGTGLTNTTIFHKINTLLAIGVLSMLIACNGDSTTPTPLDSDLLEGVFTDGPIEGVSYSTETLSGTTDLRGEFNYRSDEIVTFSIGALKFPPVKAAPVVSTLDMSSTADINDPIVANTSLLLQSLDVDGNHENGIAISDTAAASATSLDFTVPTNQFVQNTDVVNLLANSGSVTTTALDPATVIANLQGTLDDLATDATSVTTVTAYLASGAKALTGDEITEIFTGRSFISVDGRWDWTFGVNGDSFSYTRVNNISDNFPDIPWYVNGDKMCRRETPRCTKVYEFANTYRWGIEDDPEGLTDWAIKPIASIPVKTEVFDLAASLSTGPDGLQPFPRWNCYFSWLDDSGNEGGANPITFGDNGVGLTSFGWTYSWEVVNEDFIKGVYLTGADGSTDINRIFDIYNFKFSSSDAFTATNISTINVGSEDETERHFFADCVRELSE